MIGTGQLSISKAEMIAWCQEHLKQNLTPYKEDFSSIVTDVREDEGGNFHIHLGQRPGPQIEKEAGG